MSLSPLSFTPNPPLARNHDPLVIAVGKHSLTYVAPDAKIIGENGVSKGLGKPDDFLFRLLLANPGRMLSNEFIRAQMNVYGWEMHGSYFASLNAAIKFFTQKELVTRPTDGYLRLGPALFPPKATLVLPELNLRLDTEALVLQRGDFQSGQLDLDQAKLMVALMTPENDRLPRIKLSDIVNKSIHGNRQSVMRINHMMGIPQLIFTIMRGENLFASLRDPNQVSVSKIPLPPTKRAPKEPPV